MKNCIFYYMGYANKVLWHFGNDSFSATGINGEKWTSLNYHGSIKHAVGWNGLKSWYVLTTPRRLLFFCLISFAFNSSLNSNLLMHGESKAEMDQLRFHCFHRVCVMCRKWNNTQNSSLRFSFLLHRKMWRQSATQHIFCILRVVRNTTPTLWTLQMEICFCCCANEMLNLPDDSLRW